MLRNDHFLCSSIRSLRPITSFAILPRQSAPRIRSSLNSTFRNCDVEWQARPDPPASQQMQKPTKNINARDHPDTRRQEESGLMFRREENSPFSFLLVFTGAPFATIPDSIMRPYWAPPQLPPTALLVRSTFDSLLSSPIFDSTPLSISLVIAFLSNSVPTCIKAVL